MARLRTIEDLVADVLSRAGMEFSDLVDATEVCEFINVELAELRGHLRLNEGQPHKRTTGTIAVVAGTAEYALPATFWELLSVTASINGVVRQLEPFMENERARLTNSLTPAGVPMYRVAGDIIEFLPTRQTFTATIRYVSSETRLLLGQVPPDTVDGYNGYEIAAVYGAVASCKEKEETDPSFYESRKAKIYKQIDALAAQRDAGRPERVTDVTGGLDNVLDPRS